MNGFSDADYETLDGLFQSVRGQFTYTTDQVQFHVAEYWEDDALLKSAIAGHAKFLADCEGFAMVCMHKAINAGFAARLVVCTDETGTGHCICEVASRDKTQAYYFDNRRVGLATPQTLKDYVFHCVSPWNPQPGETRPWEAVAQPA